MTATSAKKPRGRGRKKKPRTLTQTLAATLSKVLLPDLRARAGQPSVERALREQWRQDKDARRTGERFDAWRGQLLEQVGAAWILSCVFVRTLEDRQLLGFRRLAGKGAADSEQLFFELAPSLGHREYLLSAFREVSRLPGAEALLGPEGNPAWRLSPSEEAVRALLAELREDDDERTPRWRFEGPHVTGTRFLGDLYQDLSESVRKRYALLQTPDFVEAFILERTLDPAIEEFGLDTVRLIDPTCGSGHFLLGAFDRLFEARLGREPGGQPRAHALAALQQVFGVDINPYAVAIARFRLTLSWLDKVGATRLREAPRLPLNLVVADSLLHGKRAALADTTTGRGENLRLSFLAEDDPAWGERLFALDDREAARKLFGQRYHAVVGNPPYITCKDKALRDAYREHYTACYREYALSAPFCERIFQLAVDAGFTGQITANSFMKREFGKKLVQEVLPHVDLTQVVDASGAYIPGHGTPTVILFGRNRTPAKDTVLAVMGKRGEPTTPQDPAKGLVWSSISAHDTEADYEDAFLSVSAVERGTFAKHPWSLGGGGAAELKQHLEQASELRLGDRVETIGFGCITKQDDVFAQPPGVLTRHGVAAERTRWFGIGEDVRDWGHAPSLEVLFPYDAGIDVLPPEVIPLELRFMWPWRTVLQDRKVFGGQTYRQAGKPWYEFGQIPSDRYRSPLSIAFAFVATHNHFVLDRGGKAFNRTAPIIKLPPDATEEDHLALLGYLNSSTACFWMKQVFFDKGNRGEGGGTTSEAWERFYEHDGTKLKSFPLLQWPLTADSPIAGYAYRLDQLGQEWAATTPSIELINEMLQSTQDATLSEAIMRAKECRTQLEGQIRWLQEELDWQAYRSFGLCDASLTRDCPADVPILLPGHRPSDLRFARETMSFGVGRRYFELCRLPPPEVVAELRLERLAQQRLAAIDQCAGLELLERPEYKRTYRESFRPSDPRPALRDWLLGKAEQYFRRSEPAIGSVSRVAHAMGLEAAVGAVAAALAGEATPDLAELLGQTIKQKAAPHLAALRFKDSGLSKHAGWQHTWDLQRREDAGEDVGEIPVPPKYATKDYRDSLYYRLRGKLDVPKERFISYPGAERDDDPSPLIGWAGWDHKQRAQALAALYWDRKETEGWGADRLTPLLAGLLELVPWLKQWHNEPDPDLGGERLGDYFEGFADGEARSLGLTHDDLRDWRPPKKKAKRKRKKKKGGA